MLAGMGLARERGQNDDQSLRETLSGYLLLYVLGALKES